MPSETEQSKTKKISDASNYLSYLSIFIENKLQKLSKRYVRTTPILKLFQTHFFFKLKISFQMV